ncbi:OsmC family peroxiredoxin [Patulibacter defluvii]|uniref:OsmC family peroxiredoxin n=1 Tax=Patulibacter defluvii TaxID=3095358 RepID=UPI002A74CC03|nr:OsmC family peroxiredoxin [Patulibacter sp. DM4]
MATRRVTSRLIDKTLGDLSERLKELRIERGLRLSDVAAMTGFSEAYLYRVEEGERSPSLAALLRLAEAHGVSPGELLDGTPEPARVASHHAMAVWDGRERDGEGRMWTSASAVSRYNRESRVGPDDAPAGMTSPEQGIGMALAGCFSMSLAQQLEAAGFEPQRIETRADVRLGVSSQGVAVQSIELTSTARVPQISAARLDDLAQHTRKTCVIARALAAVQVGLEIELVDPAG